MLQTEPNPIAFLTFQRYGKHSVGQLSSILNWNAIKLRRVAVVASQSHKLKVPGSNPGARNKCVPNGKDIDERSSRERISNL